MQKNLSQAEMEESEGIPAIVSQAAIQTVTAVMITLRDTYVGAFRHPERSAET